MIFLSIIFMHEIPIPLGVMFTIAKHIKEAPANEKKPSASILHTPVHLCC